MDQVIPSKDLNNLICSIWTVNRIDSPHQTVDDLIGIVYWGDSLLSVPGIFLGINRFGARRRATSAWMVEEIGL